MDMEIGFVGKVSSFVDLRTSIYTVQQKPSCEQGYAYHVQIHIQRRWVYSNASPSSAAII